MKFGGLENTSPCKGCADRVVGCHDKCKRYKEWRKALDKRLEIINKNKKAEADLNSERIAGIIKSKRGKR